MHVESSTDGTHRGFFRLLGPLQFSFGKQQVSLTEGRQLIVLAVLLTQINQVVSIGRLVDAVWGDTPPVTAVKQIQTCVWRLRKASINAGAAADLIETVRGGYLMRLPDGSLDIHLFEELRERGQRRIEADDPKGAIDNYRAALALFRGHPLAGLPSRALEPMVAYWTERRLTLLEECFDLELALGRHRELVGELSLLVDDHPLREQLRWRLMTALCLSDRRGDALVVYHAGRAALVSQLGLDPCARLQELHQRIITGRPILPTAAELRPEPALPAGALHGAG